MEGGVVLGDGGFWVAPEHRLRSCFDRVRPKEDKFKHDPPDGGVVRVGDVVSVLPRENFSISPSKDVGILLEVIRASCAWPGYTWCRVLFQGRVGNFYVPVEGNPL